MTDPVTLLLNTFGEAMTGMKWSYVDPYKDSITVTIDGSIDVYIEITMGLSGDTPEVELTRDAVKELHQFLGEYLQRSSEER